MLPDFYRLFGHQSQQDIDQCHNNKRIAFQIRVAFKANEAKLISDQDNDGQNVKPERFTQKDAFRIHVYLRTMNKIKRPGFPCETNSHEETRAANSGLTVFN